MKYIITISREFGCAGREIGRKIASELGVKFYDKELIDLVAQKVGIHSDIIKEADEKAGSFFNEFIYGKGDEQWQRSSYLQKRDMKRELLYLST